MIFTYLEFLTFFITEFMLIIRKRIHALVLRGNENDIKIFASIVDTVQPGKQNDMSLIQETKKTYREVMMSFISIQKRDMGIV